MESGKQLAAQPLVGVLIDPAETRLEHSGRKIIRAHARAQCSGETCSIHARSSHPLRHLPQVWFENAMWRVCEHDVGIPDPDHLDHVERTHGRRGRDYAASDHECCGHGCCQISEIHPGRCAIEGKN